jgi:hypothetical protein
MADATEPLESPLGEVVCSARQELENQKASLAVVVSGYDVRELSPDARLRFASNSRLAQQRGEHIANLLGNSDCPARPINAVVLVRGPRILNLWSYGRTSESRERLNAGLADDRRVEIYGVQVELQDKEREETD